MRKTFLFLLGAVTALSSAAMPARRALQSVVGPDGDTIKVRLMGDENFHYYVTEDGTELLTRRAGKFVRATLNSAGQLVETTQKTDPRRAMASRRQNAPLRGLYPGTAFPAKGEQKILVVLVQYQDVAFTIDDPTDYFTRMLNEENFADYYATGSARDWFIASSNNEFIPEFDVYGPVTLQRERSYYGGNNAWGQDDMPHKMAIEACRQLNATVDFSQYDRDGDGVIDNIFVVYAGRGEASGGSEDTVWPHAWTISSAEPGSEYKFDGVMLNRYACSNELEMSELGHGIRPVGIGTFIHEFSHVMGLPDLYSTSYADGTFTPGAWSAMDYGPYNNDGCTPPQYSAWERGALGYNTPRYLGKDPANLSLDTPDTGDCRIIRTNREKEYFVLENRQQTGWDEYIPGHGMLVWHIDYDDDTWTYNIVNNDPRHNYVDIIEADGLLTEATRDGDAFPGTSGVTSLGATTTPSMKSWAGISTGIELSDITERDGMIIFRINGGTPDIAKPDGLTAADILAGGFTARWNAVEGATRYDVRVYDAASTMLKRIAVESDKTSCEIDGLTPSTAYSFTVTAEDGAYGSGESEPETFITLDPTFDYFAPTATEARDITGDSFTATWEPMEGATEYFITVFTREHGESATVTAAFDGGATDLPEGWTTTTTGSYGMAGYSGKSAPSLRLAADNDNVTTATYENGLEALSFWHRGNSTTSNEQLTVEVLRDGTWEPLQTIDVLTEKGGTTTTLNISDTDVTAARITFNRVSGGAVAIDDIEARVYGNLNDIILDGYNDLTTGSALQLRVSALQPLTTYYYNLTATNGPLTSLRSNTIAVTTGEESSITAPDAAGGAIRICGNRIITDMPVTIHDIAGRTVATGISDITLSRGIYIITADGAAPVKIAVI